jgi:hypothetical protein
MNGKIKKGRKMWRARSSDQEQVSKAGKAEREYKICVTYI